MSETTDPLAVMNRYMSGFQTPNDVPPPDVRWEGVVSNMSVRIAGLESEVRILTDDRNGLAASFRRHQDNCEAQVEEHRKACAATCERVRREWEVDSARRGDLEAIVAKLPVDAEGKRVVPGVDSVWYPGRNMAHVVTGEGDAIPSFAPTEAALRRMGPRAVSVCYLNRAAAESAARGDGSK